ncbi:MAG: aspartate/glutamate racemase family protein [Thaumarchaeota archaeon]|nr:aspartate/glutamate racemase family protein [Nitrososphaerota archaeon]
MKPRARIGMIYPASGLMEREFVEMVPPDVSVHVTRVKFGKASVEENLQMMEGVEEAAMLLSLARVNLIHFNCTTGSLIGGKGYDESIIERIEHKTGVPGLTTATSVIRALKTLQLKNIGILAPYPEDIVKLEKKFFESSGFNVVWTHAENIADPEVQATTNPSKWIGLAEQLLVEADGLFISCAGIEIVHKINEIETSLGRPVVTSNQASVWACLKKLGIENQSASFGRLMRNL